MNLSMIRKNGAPVPQYELPQGFAIKPLMPDEGQKYEKVLIDAGFTTQEINGLFERDFAPHTDKLDRVLMLQDCKSGEYIGTTAAWFEPDWRGESWGKIHWVGISQMYQGKGLGKPLMTAAMNILVARHDQSYLITQPIRVKAIQMYLDYGFIPFVTEQEQVEGWKELEASLGKKIQLYYA
jgi:GNAT superfamily N-acetyltransferase